MTSRRAPFFGLLLVLLLAGCTRPKGPEPVWVGHIAQLTGAQGERGEDAVRAMQLLLEQEKKTFDGRELAVRHVDASEKRTVRAEAVRLLTVNRVVGLIVGPGVPDTDDAIATARAQGAAIVVLDDEAERQGEALARFAFAKLKRTAARLDVNQEDAFFSRLAASFTASWRRQGGTIEAEVGEAGVVLLARPTLEGKLPPGERGPILVGSRGPAPKSLPGGREVYEVTPFTAASLTQSAEQWQKRFRKRYDQAPTAAAAMGHDGLGIILDALAEAEKPTRELLLPAVGGLKTFAGLTGTLRQADGRWLRPLFLVRHHGGKSELLEALPAPER